VFPPIINHPSTPEDVLITKHKVRIKIKKPNNIFEKYIFSSNYPKYIHIEENHISNFAIIDRKINKGITKMFIFILDKIFNFIFINLLIEKENYFMKINIHLVCENYY
jgi:hypothetical protein